MTTSDLLRPGTGDEPAPRAHVDLEALAVDPYPTYARLRAEAPVAYIPEVGQWWLTRWDDVVEMDRDEARFSAEVGWSALEETIGPNMLRADGDRHRRLRSVIEPFLTPRALRDDLARIIVEVADALIDSFPTEGPVDLVDAFAEPVAVLGLRAVLGVDHLDAEEFRGWVNGISVGAANFERDDDKRETGRRASLAVDAALEPILSGARGGSGVLAALAEALAAGDLDRAEAHSTFKLFLIGGVQEVRDLVGLTIHVLLEHADHGGAIRAGDLTLHRVVEEVLRWQAPVGTITRATRTEVEIGGVTLPAGATVAGVIASANRDERRWPDPDRFDPYRRDGGHLAFAAGRHVCVGAWLGRQHAELAVARLFERLPDLRPARDAPRLSGFEFRGATYLPALAQGVSR